MANLRRLLYKLQAALMMRGRKILIGQFQSYSESTGRMVTKIVLSEKQENGRIERIFETWKIAEAVQFLANELNGGEGKC